MPVTANILGSVEDDWSVGTGWGGSAVDPEPKAPNETVQALESITDTLNKCAATITGLMKPKAGVRASGGGGGGYEEAPPYASPGEGASVWPWLIGIGVLGVGGFIAYRVVKKRRRR
jgi:hypothetical protein